MTRHDEHSKSHQAENAARAVRSRRVAAAIARRWRLGHALGLLGRGLTLAGAAAVVLVLAARGLGPAAWAIWAVIGLALLATMAALAWAMTRRRPLETAAAAADRHAGLKDALVSGLLLSGTQKSREDSGFTALAIARAEAAAQGIKPTEVAPVRLGRTWIAWPLLVSAACAAAVFVPPWGREPGVREASVALPDSEQVDRARVGIEALARALEEQAAQIENQSPSAQDDRLERQLDRLREIEEELVAGRRDPREAMTEAVAAATEAAESIEQAARERELADEALRDALSNLERTDGRQPVTLGTLPGDADRLAQAMERGNLDEAARAAEALMERAKDPQASEQDRREAAERLRELAERLDPQAAQEQRDPQSQQTPQDRTTDPASSETPQSPETQEQASQPESPASEPPQEPGTSQSEREQQPEPTPSAEQQPGQEQDDEASQQESPSDASPSTPQEQERQQDAGQRERSRQDAKERRHELSEAIREAAEQIERGQQRPEQQQEQPQGQEPQQQQSPQTQEPGQQQDPEQQGVEQGTEPGNEQGVEQGQQQGEQPDGQQGEPQQRPGQRLADRLRELADRPRDAQQQQERAEELRRQAREAFERMSPQEQRELLERLREQGQDQPQDQDGTGLQPSPEQATDQHPMPPTGSGAGNEDNAGDTTAGTTDPWQQELMDLREREGQADRDMRTVAEWFGDGQDGPGNWGSAASEDLRRAARGAREAIENERVPKRRSELIRRVFERYTERMGRDRPASGGGGS